MEAQQVDNYLISNSKYFHPVQLKLIRESLLDLDESKKFQVQTLQLKDPTLMLIVSIFAGQIGVDRILIGDVGLGIAKLLTCGGLGIWAIVDWFLIMGATKDKNFENFNRAIL
jgi:TM2 domain-containing membrane protein YozV